MIMGILRHPPPRTSPSLPFFIKLFLIICGDLPSQQIFTLSLYQTLANTHE